MKCRRIRGRAVGAARASWRRAFPIACDLAGAKKIALMFPYVVKLFY
jgi:hypothetical protein